MKKTGLSQMSAYVYSDVDNVLFKLQVILQWDLNGIEKTRLMLEKLCNSNPLLIEDLTIDILTQSYSQQDYDFFSELIDTYNQFDEHQFQEYIEKISDHQAKAISIYHPDYPKRLKKISNPPLMIFTRGKLFDFSRSIAIVGRRKPSTQAKTLAFKLAKILTERKYKIISGLAIGIDAEAHKGCLAAGGLTTAVLATPITNISPKMNIDIARSILKTGCIISERIVLTRSDKLKIRSYFPLRNRIISGLSDIVVVAESNDRGGTIRQIDYAISQQKPVLYYVPPQNHEHYPIAKAIVTKYSDYIHPFYSVEEAIDMIETYIDLINYKNMNFSNSNIQFKFYPPLPIRKEIDWVINKK